MKALITASILTLALLSGTASAGTVFDDIRNSAPHSARVFADLQMVLSALWRSANTPDAPKNNTRKAITVATIPCDCDALLMTICSTKLAASTPMVSRN